MHKKYEKDKTQQKDTERTKARNRFVERLVASGKISLEQPFFEQLIALPSDASTRRYFRILQREKNLLLMDAPPELEKPREFIRIAKYLRAIGLRAPQVYDADAEGGFLLIEDFGDDSFSKLLDSGYNPRELYQDAVDVLLHILDSRDAQEQEQEQSVYHPPDEAAFWGAELDVFCDYYYSALLGARIAQGEQQGDRRDEQRDKQRDKQQGERRAAAKKEWRECWRSIFASLPPLPRVAVLRDCHVDNLMRVAEETVTKETSAGEPVASSPLSRCGLLDFQDAVLGSPAYDLVSLLEDARRDLAPALREQLLSRYLSAASKSFDSAEFLLHYKVWAAQRHARVLGTFARLALRDNKQGLSRHMPRVLRLLDRCLTRDGEEASGAQPILQPLARWFATYLPEHEAKLARCLHEGIFKVAE